MKYIPIIIAASFLTACASTEDVYKQASHLNYEAEPVISDILKRAKPLIKARLKDPDSLKNLNVAESYKCYASKMEMSDNVSPKYDYGYWCYDFSYRATNSYGGYVPGKNIVIYYQGRLLSVNELNETVRKFDDVKVWHSPTTL